MTKYEVIEHWSGETQIKWDDNGVIRFIPTDPANSDYQRYLRWLENPDADETMNVLTPTQEPGVVTNGDN